MSIGHELDRKWRVPKEMIGRRLSQEEAKGLLRPCRQRPRSRSANEQRDEIASLLFRSVPIKGRDGVNLISMAKRFARPRVEPAPGLLRGQELR